MKVYRKLFLSVILLAAAGCGGSGNEGHHAAEEQEFIWLTEPSIEAGSMQELAAVELPGSADHIGYPQEWVAAMTTAVYQTDAIAFTQGGKTGFMTYDGTVITEPVYDSIGYYPGIGFTGTKGDVTELLSRDLKDAEVTEEEPAEDEEFWYLEKEGVFYTGDPHHPEEAEQETFLCRSDACIVYHFNDEEGITGSGLYNATGDFMTEINGIAVPDRSHPYANGYVPAKKSLDDEQMFIVDVRSGKAINDQFYEDMKWFSDGFIPVKKNGKWGFVNIRGREVIPCQYEDVSTVFGSKAFIKEDGKYGILNVLQSATSPEDRFDMVGDNFKESYISLLYAMNRGNFYLLTNFSEAMTKKLEEQYDSTDKVILENLSMEIDKDSYEESSQEGSGYQAQFYARVLNFDFHRPSDDFETKESYKVTMQFDLSGSWTITELEKDEEYKEEKHNWISLD